MPSSLMTLAPTELTVVKERQRTAWASGDYSAIATLIVPVAERLCDAADLHAGWQVLDVATGSGNAAIAAARLGCEVTGIDYVPALLERAEERACAERLSLAFAEGDAERIPFPDASFDGVLSVFGAMFAPDHARTASELVRVTCPGGAIALASWTPEGFLGALFRTIASHVAHPEGLASPMLWGSEAHLVRLFGTDVVWTHRRRTFTFRFPSAASFVETFVRCYGPIATAVEAAGAPLVDDFYDLVHSWNKLPGSGPVAVPCAYLESIGTRR